MERDYEHFEIYLIVELFEDGYRSTVPELSRRVISAKSPGRVPNPTGALYVDEPANLKRAMSAAGTELPSGNVRIHGEFWRVSGPF